MPRVAKKLHHHLDGVRFFVCECKRRNTFHRRWKSRSWVARIMECRNCKRLHVRDRADGHEEVQFGRYGGMPELPLVSDFEIVGGTVRISGADGMFVIERDLILSCTHCEWSGDEGQAARHHDKHLERLARTA